MASDTYTINPTRIDIRVPFGIASFGDFKSPDMATPAVKPVTAGKNIAKSIIKSGEFPDAVSAGEAASKSLDRTNPKTIDISERAMAPRIKYCVFIAILVLCRLLLPIK
jgi:hypothetical protein